VAPEQPVVRVVSGDLIARARAALSAPPKTRILAAAPPPPRVLVSNNTRYRRKLVVAIDATASRYRGWTAARAMHDRILKSLPERFEVALAVYHNDLDTFTPFMSNRHGLRARASRLDCDGMRECLPEVLARVAKINDAVDVINISDASAECRPVAREYAETMRARGGRLFLLLDPSDGMSPGYTPPIYAEMAARTGGAVLPFHASRLSELLRFLDQSIAERTRHG
jgi:hypothetical protein